MRLTDNEKRDAIKFLQEGNDERQLLFPLTTIIITGVLS